MYPRLFSLVTIILIALLGGLYTAEFYQLDANRNFSKGNFSEKLPLDVPVQKKNTISLVGDIMLSRNVANVQAKYGNNYVFAALPQLASTTYLVGNFENPIPAEYVPTPNMTLNFSAPSSSAQALESYGFTHMGLANNHTFDKGLSGFLNTKSVLDSKNIISFGGREIGSSSVSILTIDERSIALIAIEAVYSTPDMGDMATLVDELSEYTDVQIAYIHWGEEYQLKHSNAQEKLAYSLIDMGMDAIIGHHPHVVQDIEQYKGATIFYSLGNFVFDQYFSIDVQQGLWVDINIVDDKMKFTLKPVTSEGSFSQPRFMSEYNKELFMKKLLKRSSVTFD